MYPRNRVARITPHTLLSVGLSFSISNLAFANNISHRLFVVSLWSIPQVPITLLSSWRLGRHRSVTHVTLAALKALTILAILQQLSSLGSPTLVAIFENNRCMLWKHQI